MDFGICGASKIDEGGYITHAEHPGYTHTWVTESHLNGLAGTSSCYCHLWPRHTG